ncbi:hypothetical protein CDL15_Pgr026502 [Punica granatum]|uniref:DUF7788 domain-containing protein n=1 Tax=Punica granatum TaxID=22663 RepID=A0A218WLD8_PUNGR|nr:hypothetical protein CDL15_Pgr026502 [Punica granatum]
MAPLSFLAPPELYIARATTEAPSAATPSSDPFVDAMVADFNKFASCRHPEPPMGLTENGSATYLSSGNPCLDFFFQICDSDSEGNSDSDGGAVAELQWKRMVDDLLKSGKLENCVAVCDVSGSMYGIPMEVSVALGILVSELSKEPWKGKVITFSESPQLHLIEGDDLAAKSRFVRHMEEWGYNTDFQKVFDLILKVAKNGKLSSDQIVKRIFVFSDMEFDQASRNPWETDYQVIKEKFRKAGYEDVVPQIVFWNLRDSTSTPVCKDQDGVALVSGFSKNLLKIFLNNGGQISPDSVLLDAISGEEYQKLVVVD